MKKSREEHAARFDEKAEEYHTRSNLVAERDPTAGEATTDG